MPQGPYPGTGLPGPQPAWGGQPTKKSPLPWILGGGGGLVVIIIVVVILVMTLGGGGSPQATAQQAVDDFNSGNIQGMVGIVCAQDQADLQRTAQNFNPTQQLQQLLQDPAIPDDVRQALQNIKPHFALASVTKDSDSHATATITVSITGLPADLPPELQDLQQQLGQPHNFPFDVIKENGGWKVCSLGNTGSSQPGN